jgi:hypothetical protein
VLECDGSFLHSQGTAELEEGTGYNEKVFADFLDRWKRRSVAQPLGLDPFALLVVTASSSVAQSRTRPRSK